MASLLVELVERNLLALGGSWIERDRTGDERQAQKAFPVGARGHVRGTPFSGVAGRVTFPILWLGCCRTLIAHDMKSFTSASGIETNSRVRGMN
jgi:hypothetical protein